MEGTQKKDNTVFIVSIIIAVLISLWGIMLPENFESMANNVFGFLTTRFGWLYLIAMFGFVVFALAIAFSKYGKIRLGPDGVEPEHSYLSWFAMLFSAGMGIGLVFWGAAEPLNHFMAPMAGIEPGSAEAANFAMTSSFMHWGIHPWANYTIIALPLAYMQFRRNKPGLISSIFIPLIGEEGANGPIGKTIDILAIFATIAGVATSLGLGVLQINGGLNYLFNIPINTFVNIAIIVIVTILFIISAVTGIDKGIKMLSNTNVALGLALMVLTFILGPTTGIVNSFTNALGDYTSNFIESSFKIEAFGENDWLNAWRIFYWAWWIAWAPFVSSFIARISKGRTIKEFVIGVSVVPALASLVWFAVFGGTGLNLGPEVATEAMQVTETALFVVMEHVPLGSVISLVAIVLLCTFFITSADSATFVLGMFSKNGDLNPSAGIKVLWGIIQSLMAFALMQAGGLEALQTGSIAAAFPFIFIMIFACVSFVKALREEDLEQIEKLQG